MAADDLGPDLPTTEGVPSMSPTNDTAGSGFHPRAAQILDDFASSSANIPWL
jgi:hypothetical protein